MAKMLCAMCTFLESPCLGTCVQTDMSSPKLPDVRCVPALRQGRLAARKLGLAVACAPAADKASSSGRLLLALVLRATSGLGTHLIHDRCNISPGVATWPASAVARAVGGTAGPRLGVNLTEVWARLNLGQALYGSA